MVYLSGSKRRFREFQGNFSEKMEVRLKDWTLLNVMTTLSLKTAQPSQKNIICKCQIFWKSSYFPTLPRMAFLYVYSKLYIENSCTVKWILNIMLRKKVNRKVQEQPPAEAAANPDTRRKRKKKWHTLTWCGELTNKCTISTKTSSLFPKQGDRNAKRAEKHIDKEQGTTKQPRSVNYRAT